MISIPKELFKKHEIGIEAARRYYVLNEPTGFSDDYYTNVLEAEARKDGLELRDFVTQEIQGKRSQNAEYIGKVEKCQVEGDMVQAISEYIKNVHPEIEYLTPKYDGSSLAAYYDTATGRCVRVVTIGGVNLGNEGIDQTEKLGKFFPDLPKTGICAIQAECLVSLEHGFGESSRQKANGLINSSFEPLTYEEFLSGSQNERTERDYERYLRGFEENLLKVKREVNDYLNIRAFRYFLDDSEYAKQTARKSYIEVMNSLPMVKDSKNDVKFCRGFIFQLRDYPELSSKIGVDFMNKDIWPTGFGTFLVDGVVGYDHYGKCVKALKYKDAGRGESTTVRGIRWNNQVTKGKDAWSANAIIDPVSVRGSKITKPTIGSIKKMVETGLSNGAKVTIILANSTIPQVSEVLTEGDKNFEWPRCSCGYQMSENDIFGIRLKCGNPMCSERLERMRKYLESTGGNWDKVSFTKLLVIDGVDFEKKGLDNGLMYDCLREGEGKVYSYLSSFLTTNNQLRNLDLVIGPAYKALVEYYGNR